MQGASRLAAHTRMRRVLACLSLLSAVAMLDGIFACRPSPIGAAFSPLLKERGAAALTASAASEADRSIDASALQEMLRGPNGQARHWDRDPELTILVSVMQYHNGEQTAYTATAEQLTDREVDDLTRDLTAGLALLTGNTYDKFAAVHREVVPAGTTMAVLRPGQILAGRYRDVQTLQHTIGFGGSATRTDGTITGAAIILDKDFDTSSPKRRLLRFHELGHALGYNHVSSRTSIMNATIGPEPTDFDRSAALLAFRPPFSVSAN